MGNLFGSVILISLTIGTSVQASVSFERKVQKVRQLKELTENNVLMTVSGYERELEYESQQLSIDKRAELEREILTKQIRNQVCQNYDQASKELQDSDSAFEQVKMQIENDLNLIALDLREEIREISLKSLEECQQGFSSIDQVATPKLNMKLLKLSKERSAYLNEPDPDEEMGYPVTIRSRDSERRDYNTKEELLQSLLSNKESTRWVTTGNQTFKSAAVKKNETKISMQVKVEFLGVALEAGPVVNFKREFSTSVNVMAEGLTPVLLADGNFDYYKRDERGNLIRKGGKEEKRFLSFFCETELEFESEYAGEGGFSYMGIGGSTSFSSTFKNLVSIDSRRIGVPEFIGGKSVTIKYLSDLCHNDFLNAKFNSTMTIKQSLQTMMKNMIAGLIFSHPKTKCGEDKDCMGWFYNSSFVWHKTKIQPRCVEDPKEKYRYCVVRGLQGTKCHLFDKSGRLLSDGQFEINCDNGLFCAMKDAGSSFLGWEYEKPKGECRPVNPKTYKKP